MRGRSLPAMRRVLVVLVVVAAACSSPAAETTTSAATSSTSTSAPVTTAPATTSAADTTTTAVEPVETILYDHWKGSFTYGEGLRIDVHAPDDRSNHPIAITIHGGGWFGGRLDSMGHLADGLAARGFVVFNATYRTIANGGTFPDTVEDVACAVAYARAHALDYSTSADHFTLIGHSAGAHLSSLVAFAPGVFGGACDEADIPVDAFVGLAGSYDTDIYAFLLRPFFGTAFATDPEPWKAGNPYTYVDRIGDDVDLLFIHGDADELVPTSMSEDLYLVVDRAGAAAGLRIVSGAGHGEVNSPRVVGDLIAEFVAADQ